MPLVSVVGDQNSHGAGQLLTPPQTQWSLNGKLVCTIDTIAASDNLEHPTGDTNSSSGSGKMFVAGKAIHRHGDLRYCTATTVVSGQSKFYVGA